MSQPTKLVHRGSNPDAEKHPDTKIPITVLPKEINDLQSAVVELNLGHYEANDHYAAMAYIDALKTYMLFYRNPPNPWSLQRIHLLKPDMMESLFMVDGDKSLQELMNREMGIRPVKFHSTRRRNKNKYNAKKKDRKTKKTNRKNK
jgi:hypothetical protein